MAVGAAASSPAGAARSSSNPPLAAGCQGVHVSSETQRRGGVGSGLLQLGNMSAETATAIGSKSGAHLRGGPSSPALSSTSIVAFEAAVRDRRPGTGQAIGAFEVRRLVGA